MKTAEQIMAGKAFIKAELDKHTSQGDALWKRSTEKLETILDRYRSLPKGVRAHTDSRIFPSAAIYLTVKDEIGADAAFHVLEDAAVTLCGGFAGKLKKLMKVPGMRRLFIRMWDPLTRKLFGPGNGFTNVFYPKKKGEFRMDVTACPYCRYFTELGCPELTTIYCGNDERIYGDLPGLKFERTGTLGRGADRCDFCMRIDKDAGR